MSGDVTSEPAGMGDARAFSLVVWHSLMWLSFCCAVGVLLSVLLLVPSLGVILEPFSYGRWMTVHLNASLYGWSSLPLIGLLFMQYLPRDTRARAGESAVGVWSGVLLFACAGWLSGQTSGKLFMEWTGLSRWAIAGSMAWLAAALGVSLVQRMRSVPGETRWLIAGKFALLSCLSTIPVVMYRAADPQFYPPINPDSGGATGGSLLGSTLALVMIFWFLPFILQRPRRSAARFFIVTGLLLALHSAWFAVLDHGDRSHHEPAQIVALASLAIWVPVLIAHLRGFEWPRETLRWLLAFAAWGAALTLNGIVSFLPGVLEHAKFTNAMVAHVHVAMAGMITQFNMLLLVLFTRRAGGAAVFDAPALFWTWQVGTVIHAAALLAAGMLESAHPSWLFTGHPAIVTLYAIRFLAGLAMAATAFAWWRRAHFTEKESA